jgi:predicted DNA-binding protein with PD1-like motif
MAEKDRQEQKKAAHASETFAADFWKPHLGQNRFRSVAGRPGRLITGRLLPGTDLVEGILAMAGSHEVASGYIDAFGSLAQARFSAGVRYSASQPERVERIPLETVEGPLEFLCGQGKLGKPSQGDPVIHFHGIFVTPEGEVRGGHFFAGGNPVFATFEVVIHEILEVEQVWQKDEEAGVYLIEAVQKNEG